MNRKLITTLCIVHKHPNILLGMKKRGFGEGRWNGFGGKVNAGESIEEAARREMKEEAGVEVKNLTKHGIINFEFQGNPETIEMHIFRADDFLGEPTESEEMKPEWFHVNEIPFNKMWPDDKHWVPMFLASKKFRGRFLFGKGDAILNKYLEEVKEI